MPAIELVVFDWDGTVVDSTLSITDSIREACRDIGIAVPPAEDARWVIGLGLQDALSRVAPNLDADQQLQLTDRFRHHYLSRYESLQMFPGVMEILLRLTKSGIPLAVATGKTRVGLERSFDLTATRHLFQTSRCADESKPKPAPAMVLEICSELGISPSSTLVIGDTTHDIFMAKSAGARALAVGYGAHAADELLSAQPMGCMHSVQELDDWISAWITK
ncbi:MAG: HAD-IA family hydrolase [Burkholderiaceae bacterium]|nr:HAD-IA family hydrolase [Burkholderiaceae bacterium]